MKLELAGLRFEVTSEGGLTSAEIEAMLTLGASDSRFSAGSSFFQLELVSPEEPAIPDAAEQITGPAQITSRGDTVIVSHSRFVAELDPLACRGRLTRNSQCSAALEITLRTALCCVLPLQGGVALHAAGIDVDGRGMVFFGPSGAGKTTFSSLSPYPVFSDELVAVTGSPWKLHRTGVWGELGHCANAAEQPQRLTLLGELAKGTEFELQPLDETSALRRLLGVVVLPPSIPLWTEATRVLRDLVTSIPVYRMSWSPDHPPWVGLENQLAGSVAQPQENTAVATRSVI
ncbi:MAG: hypothetical protein ACC645_15965, partial [Pirellulales bacterium]